MEQVETPTYSTTTEVLARWRRQELSSIPLVFCQDRIIWESLLRIGTHIFTLSQSGITKMEVEETPMSKSVMEALPPPKPASLSTERHSETLWDSIKIIPSISSKGSTISAVVKIKLKRVTERMFQLWATKNIGLRNLEKRTKLWLGMKLSHPEPSRTSMIKTYFRTSRLMMLSIHLKSWPKQSELSIRVFITSQSKHS